MSSRSVWYCTTCAVTPSKNFRVRAVAFVCLLLFQRETFGGHRQSLSAPDRKKQLARQRLSRRLGTLLWARSGFGEVLVVIDVLFERWSTGVLRPRLSFSWVMAVLVCFQISRTSTASLSSLYGFQSTHDGLSGGCKLRVTSEVHEIVRIIFNSVFQFIHTQCTMRPPDNQETTFGSPCIPLRTLSFCVSQT